MDFTFSDEQEALRSSVREFLQARYPIERVAEIADSEEGFDRSEWKAVAEQGWIGIPVPEERGGAGLRLIDELIVVEEMGRSLFPGPYLSTVVMGLGVLEGAGIDLSNVLGGERLLTLAWAGADGTFALDPAPKLDLDGGRISGERIFVPDVRLADAFLVVGSSGEGDGAHLVERDAEAVEWRELPTVDGTRRLGEVRLERAIGERLELEDGALWRLRDRTLAALAVEAVGVGSRALDLAVEHAKGRQQFGRAVGTFQGVSHPLAQTFVEIETARSLAYYAGWAVSEGAPEASMAAAAAKARAADAAVAACERAIQAHGGVGFTWEHPLHRYYKRALQISAFLGWGGELRSRVASALLD